MRFSIKGFTLVEIMIVVSVIGMLAVIAIPGFVRAREAARRSSCINNQRIIYGAAAIYEIETGNTLEGLGRAEALQTLLDEGYVRNNSCFECPSSDIKDYDDYQLVYQNNKLVNVNCTYKGDEHPWP